MNDVRPFRAIHYNPERIGEIGPCLSQPYDVISPDQQLAYYKRHEYNVVRLILNREEPEDNETNNRYTRARRYLQDWLKNGILKSTQAPSFWVYEQEYETPLGARASVKGFIGIVRLRDFDEGCVIPHERVMKGPIEDRMRLARSTETQFESIWSFYEDSSGELDSVLEETCRKAPSLDYIEKPFDAADLPVRHRLWNCQESEYCHAIQERMKALKIYIADGHHRYHTMLQLRNEKRKEASNTDAGPWEYILMWLVNSASNDITIRPYHRMIHSVDAARIESLLDYLKGSFEIVEYPDIATQRATTEALQKLRDIGENSHSFGIFMGEQNRFFTATLQNENRYLRAVDLPASSDAWKLLDVNILNNFVLRMGLEITEQDLADQRNVKYTHSASEAIERVQGGEMQMAFLLNPTKLEEVITLSQNGEVLPGKSTFFYPKPVSGLAFYPMAERT